MKGTFTHPEAFREVLTEFKRLHEKFPDMEGSAKWAMARDYAWTMALADSAIIRSEIALGSL